MAAEMIPGEGSADPLPLGALRPTSYLGPVPSSCPPEYAGVPVRELFARIDAARQARAAAAAGESLAAGFCPRTPQALPPPSRSGSGFESGGVLDTSAPGGTLAGLADAVTRDGRLAGLDDDETSDAVKESSCL